MKTRMSIAMLAAMLFCVVATASATIFEERFDRTFAVAEGQRAIYNFNLTRTGGRALVKEGATLINGPWSPTQDVTDFDPLAYSINSATLSLKLAGWDQGFFLPDENIRIRITGEDDGNHTLFSGIYSLGVHRFDFSLDPAWVADGRLRTVALARVATDGILPGLNDFKVRYAALNVDASAPVPEPSTMLLLGTGLAGLVAARRRKMKQAA